MKKILIVDDNFHNLFLLQTILMEQKFDCRTANNGKKAIALLEQHDFDIILMDIEMPEMNGIETTKYIRTKFQTPKNETPIIAITAHGTENKLINTAGFDFVMVKTHSSEKIMKIVNKYLSAV